MTKLLPSNSNVLTPITVSKPIYVGVGRLLCSQKLSVSRSDACMSLVISVLSLLFRMFIALHLLSLNTTNSLESIFDILLNISMPKNAIQETCLLYTSDAADD